MHGRAIYRLCIIGLSCLALSVVGAVGQIQTETQTTTGAPTQEVKVERGEVMFVSGHDLIIKMESGEVRYLAGVPDTARAMVDGKEIGIADVKVGMKLQKTITTTTVPETVRTVQTVKGTVVHVMPPANVTLRMENGEVKKFKIPKGQMFDIDGKQVDAFGLREGMRVSATKVVTAPSTSVSEQAQVSGTMPANSPVIIEEAAADAPAVAALPKTASPLPLVGLLGLLSLGLGLGAGVARRAFGAGRC